MLSDPNPPVSADALRPKLVLDFSESSDWEHGGAQFFRQRLVLVCKVIALIDVVYITLFTLAVKLDTGADLLAILSEMFSLEVLGEYALLTVIWLGTGLRSWSLSALRMFDAGLILGLGCLWSSWCFIHPYPAVGAHEMVLALVAAPLLRAVLVPSTGVRTCVLTALACAPGLASAFIASKLRKDTLMSPATLTLFVLNWCAISVVFSTVGSSVIYGLRTAVRRARRMGQYTLLAKIGQGGMGVVFLAQHALLRRRTVVKVLPIADSSPEAFDRFEREAQLTSQLTHPNTIAIYDFGRTQDGSFYYAMEYLEGMDLERMVAANGPCPPARAIHLLLQACGALQEAHERGLLHRDIKPSNLFVCPWRGTPDAIKVLDFGLVKDLAGSGRGTDDLTVTRSGSLIGTPHYMSPELIEDPTDLDGRSDIYALGAVAYFLLCGRPPFDGRTLVEICSKHLYTPPVRPSVRLGRALPVDLEQVVMRCLEKDRQARHADVSELAEALAACRDATRWSAHHARRWWSEQGRLAQTQASQAAESARPATIEIDLARRDTEIDPPSNIRCRIANKVA